MYNKFSRVVTKDDSQPAAQAMLHAIGLSEEDFDKPFIGIGSTGYEGNPCNMHLNDLSVNTHQVFYKDGQLYIEGFDGKGFVNIYSIIGNKIFASEVFNLSLNKKLNIDLKPGNMFIIQVHLNNKIKTFKIIA